MGEGGLLRVEVEDAPVGVTEVGDPAAPHVHQEGRRVGDVAKSEGVVDHEVVEIPLTSFAVHRLGADPLGSPVGSVLLVERRPVDAVGVAGQYETAVLEVRQHERRDGVVVGDHVPLGHARLGVQHLVEVGQGDGPLDAAGDGARLGKEGLGVVVGRCGPGIGTGLSGGPDALGGVLVVAEPQERGVSEMPGRGEFLVPDLGHETGFHPVVTVSGGHLSDAGGTGDRRPLQE